MMKMRISISLAKKMRISMKRMRKTHNLKRKRNDDNEQKMDNY